MVIMMMDIRWVYLLNMQKRRCGWGLNDNAMQRNANKRISKSVVKA